MYKNDQEIQIKITVNYHLIPDSTTTIKKKKHKTNAEEDTVREHSHTLVGWKITTHTGKQVWKFF